MRTSYIPVSIENPADPLIQEYIVAALSAYHNKKVVLTNSDIVNIKVGKRGNPEETMSFSYIIEEK